MAQPHGSWNTANEFQNPQIFHQPVSFSPKRSTLSPPNLVN
jgi:hypothetical protein